MITGFWTYRSYHNETALIGDNPQAALALIFGEGVFDLRAGDGTQFGGTLDMGNDYALTLRGTVEPGSTDGPIGFHIIGLGIDNTPTAGWRYDYRGVTSVAWPNAVAQIPCLLGTVIRVHPHGPSAPAGVTASFIAVRQPGGPGAAPAPQGEATP